MDMSNGKKKHSLTLSVTVTERVKLFFFWKDGNFGLLKLYIPLIQINMLFMSRITLILGWIMNFYYIRPDMSHNSLKICSLSLKLMKLHIFKINVFICILIDEYFS